MDQTVETYETLGRRISGAYESLSPALKAVARVVTQNPNDIGILNLTALSTRHKVPASNFVRFSKAMGFSGFSDLQMVYRNRIEEIIPSPEDRLERFSQETGALRNDSGPLTALIREDFRLLSELDFPAVERTCTDMASCVLGARRVFVTGAMRFHSISLFLHFSLTYLGLNSTLLDNQGFYAREYAQCFDEDTVLLVTTFSYYHRDVLGLAEMAAKRGAKLLAITDFDFSPVATSAKHCVFLPGLGDNFRVSPAPALIVAQHIVNQVAALKEANENERNGDRGH